MRPTRLLPATVFAALLLLPSPACADTFNISMNTSPLIGDVAGPFELVFELTDGTGGGDGNNTVILSRFSLGPGGSSGAPTTFGAVGGDIDSAFTFVDSSFLNYLIQPFSPGPTLNFIIDTTDNVDVGSVPDGFVFFITDRTGNPIPTEAGPFADMFLTVTFDSSHPSIETFASDSGRIPAGGGGPISIAAPEATVVPEPGMFFLFPLGLAWLVGFRAMRRR